VKDTYSFNFPGPPSEFVDVFRKYYGPTMNAFEAAETNGRADDLQQELKALFRPNATPDGKDDPLGRQKNRRVEIVFARC